MKLSELKEEASQDLQIDRTDLETSILNLSMLCSKWHNYRIEQASIVSLNQFKYKKLEAKKKKYYLGKLTEDEMDRLGWESEGYKVLKGDVQMWLDDDDDLITEAQKLTYQKEILNFIEKQMDLLDSNKWLIKDLINVRKFLEGG